VRWPRTHAQQARDEEHFALHVLTSVYGVDARSIEGAAEAKGLSEAHWVRALIELLRRVQS